MQRLTSYPRIAPWVKSFKGVFKRRDKPSVDPMESYSVQQESKDLLFKGIVNNPLHRDLPPELAEAANSIEFVGTPQPVVPINWRYAESMASLKGFEAAMLNVLLKRKYGVDYKRVVIDT